MSSADLGSYGIGLALLAAICSAMTATGSALSGSRPLLRAHRWALGAATGLLTTSLYALARAFLGDDFTIAYVAEYSEKALPTSYKLAAVWAGQSGSFLLWAWLLAALSWLAMWIIRKQPHKHQASTGAILAVASAAFAALLLFGANPFELAKVAQPDGAGLNPMLQDPAMVAHPPLLFAGYAAFTVPFALLLGALIARREDNDWLFGVRRWTLGAWVLLTLGIFLGSWWAYIELGWGGYWAWDPVENASLLPWLTATGVLHTLIVQQRKGMLKVFNAATVSVTFLLCLVGSYLTRSGVIQSVHAFPESWVGWFFLGMIGAGLIVTAIVMALRFKLLWSGPSLKKIVSWEAALLIGAVLLCVMAAAVLVGTIMPIISKPFVRIPVSLEKDFYNKFVLPVALVVAALMATGPLLNTLSNPARLVKRLIAGGAGMIGGIVVAVLVYPVNPWMIASLAIIGFGVFTILDDFIRTLGRPLNSGGGVAGVGRTLRANTRRFSAFVTHLGMFMIVAGVAGSGLFGVSKVLSLTPGESARAVPSLLASADQDEEAAFNATSQQPDEQDPNARGYTVSLKSIDRVTGKNYEALEAIVDVKTPAGKDLKLEPQKRAYYKWKQANTEVALDMGLREDLYVILHGVNEAGRTVLTVLVTPLVSWIWIGSILMAITGTLCILHRRPKRIETVASGAGRVSEAPDAVEKRQVPPPLRQR